MTTAYDNYLTLINNTVTAIYNYFEFYKVK